MRNFIITVEGKQYQVGVEEAGGASSPAQAVPLVSAPAQPAPQDALCDREVDNNRWRSFWIGDAENTGGFFTEILLFYVYGTDCPVWGSCNLLREIGKGRQEPEYFLQFFRWLDESTGLPL